MQELGRDFSWWWCSTCGYALPVQLPLEFIGSVIGDINFINTYGRVDMCRHKRNLVKSSSCSQAAEVTPHPVSSLGMGSKLGDAQVYLLKTNH